jgi:hypothetical protein
MSNVAAGQMAKEKLYSQPCTVVSVDAASKTCIVTPTNGDANRKARLTAYNGNLILYPVVGSFVIITYINRIDCYVAMFSEVDNFEYVIDGKFTFENGDESLKGLINDLITAIKAITVTTPAGPSGLPVNIADFTAINTRFNTLLDGS